MRAIVKSVNNLSSQCGRNRIRTPLTQTLSTESEVSAILLIDVFSNSSLIDDAGCHNEDKSCYPS